MNSAQDLSELLAFLKVTNVDDAKQSITGLRERVMYTRDYETLLHSYRTKAPHVLVVYDGIPMTRDDDHETRVMTIDELRMMTIDAFGENVELWRPPSFGGSTAIAGEWGQMAIFMARAGYTNGAYWLARWAAREALLFCANMDKKHGAPFELFQVP